MNYVPSGSVAPGLAVTAEVEFRMSEADTGMPKFHDKIVVVTGKDEVEVPLLATVPAPFLSFDGVLDLGLCLENQVSRQRAESAASE